MKTAGNERFRLAEAEKNIRAQFGEEAFAALPAGEPAAAMALGGLLSYLYETQKTDLSHIRTLDYYRQGRFMELDLARPAESGTDGNPPGQGEEGQPSVGAG